MRHLVLLACMVLALSAVIGLGDMLVAAPYRANAERIATLQLELEGVTARIEQLRHRLAAAEASEPLDLGKLGTQGADENSALAALQERVRRAVATHGGQALSTVGSATVIPGGVSRLVVGLTGRFEEAALFAFLRELEGGPPPLVVEGLAIRPLPVPGGLPLDINLSLVSFAVGRDAT